MIDKIKSISLKKNGFSEREFKLVNKDVFYLYYNNLEKQVEEDFVSDFIDNFFRIISEWEENYSKHKLLDNETFILKIEFSDNSYKEYAGTSYPDNFNVLEDLINELIRVV